MWANYRRIAECCVQAELTVELEIEITRENSRQTVRQRYDVDMWFDMEGKIAGEYGGFRLHRCKNEDSGVKLDEYLVPVLGWEDVEEEAEKIIFQLVPEGLHDPSKLKPEAFAKRLGLKIVDLPLYKRPRTSSILFFGAGEVQAASDGSSNAEFPVSVDIEANTIVLNSRMRRRSEETPFSTSAFILWSTGSFFSFSRCTTTILRASGNGNRSLYRKTNAVPLNGLSGRRMWAASVCRFRAHCSEGE